MGAMEFLNKCISPVIWISSQIYATIGIGIYFYDFISDILLTHSFNINCHVNYTFISSLIIIISMIFSAIMLMRNEFENMKNSDLNCLTLCCPLLYLIETTMNEFRKEPKEYTDENRLRKTLSLC